jgi:hypothetical protein
LHEIHRVSPDHQIQFRVTGFQDIAAGATANALFNQCNWESDAAVLMINSASILLEELQTGLVVYSHSSFFENVKCATMDGLGLLLGQKVEGCKFAGEAWDHFFSSNFMKYLESESFAFGRRLYLRLVLINLRSFHYVQELRSCAQAKV